MSKKKVSSGCDWQYVWVINIKSLAETRRNSVLTSPYQHNCCIFCSLVRTGLHTYVGSFHRSRKIFFLIGLPHRALPGSTVRFVRRVRNENNWSFIVPSLPATYCRCWRIGAYLDINWALISLPSTNALVVGCSIERKKKLDINHTWNNGSPNSLPQNPKSSLYVGFLSRTCSILRPEGYYSSMQERRRNRR